MTHYEVLGVAPSASAAEIKRAYRQQAQRHHPDVGGGEDVMERLNRAWATLGDPVRRRAYDNVLGVGVARPSAPPPPAPPVVDIETDDGEEDFGPEPPPAESTKHDVLFLVPAALLAAAVGTFALSVVLTSPFLQGLSIGVLALAAVSFAFVPVITLRRQARRTYR